MTGKELKEIQEKLGMSQPEFAIILGLKSGISVYRMEKEKRGITPQTVMILEA